MGDKSTLTECDAEPFALTDGVVDVAHVLPEHVAVFVHVLARVHTFIIIGYVRAGEYVDAEGKVLGYHEGYVNYTIGQRKGLGIALGHPAYITHIDAENNRITLGTNEDMYATELHFRPYFLRPLADISESSITAKVRYRSQAVPVQTRDGDRLIFAVPVWGVTPGQSLVLYQDDLVIGGGIIL